MTNKPNFLDKPSNRYLISMPFLAIAIASVIYILIETHFKPAVSYIHIAATTYAISAAIFCVAMFYITYYNHKK